MATRATAHRREDLAGRGPGGGPSCSNVRVSSVVSTFLVSFGVVAAAIAAVVHVVLNGPDQPPTIRKQPSRAKDRARRRPVRQARPAAPETATAGAPSRPAAVRPVTPAFAGPDSEIMRLRLLPAHNNSVWVRIRSGIVLVVLVAILGALLALAIAGLGLGLALLVRGATG